MKHQINIPNISKHNVNAFSLREYHDQTIHTIPLVVFSTLRPLWLPEVTGFPAKGTKASIHGLMREQAGKMLAMKTMHLARLNNKTSKSKTPSKVSGGFWLNMHAQASSFPVSWASWSCTKWRCSSGLTSSAWGRGSISLERGYPTLPKETFLYNNSCSWLANVECNLYNHVGSLTVMDCGNHSCHSISSVETNFAKFRQWKLVGPTECEQSVPYHLRRIADIAW